MQLPPDLKAGLDDVLGALSAGRLKASALDLSRRYRAGPGQGRLPLLQSTQDVSAYLAVRLPATYAAVHQALRQAFAALPDCLPASQLDVGAGPGTAAWAAAATWSSIEACTFVERDAEMIRLGQRLAEHAAADPLRTANWLAADLAHMRELPSHDLVTAAYVVGELSEVAQDRLVGQLWQATEDLLVLVEPGTPAGFARIRRARSQLLASGAHLAAPCPHELACPMAGGDWCHFAQRVERSALHRRTKGAELGHEDEKFSFIAASRQAALPITGRIIRHPQARSGHVRLEICGPEGLRNEVVARSEGARYRAAKGLTWGAQLPWLSPGPDDPS